LLELSCEEKPRVLTPAVEEHTAPASNDNSGAPPSATPTPHKSKPQPATAQPPPADTAKAAMAILRQYRHPSSK
jgi:hypothetical protein